VISPQVHPTAIIADGATIGANVSVGPYAIIEDNVCVGDGSEEIGRAHV
jgi:UDP-N-acetylglucosamine acyltransferase